MTKYLLSTGASTTKVEKYILDLFRVYFNIYPGDIPNSNIGFNLVLTDTKKDELLEELRGRVDNLIIRIRDRFLGSLNITIENLALISETRARLEISVNDYSDILDIDIYNNNNNI